MFKLLAIILAVYSLFNPTLGGGLFLAFVILLEGVVGLAARPRPTRLKGDWEPDEQQVINDYHFFFRTPMTARKLSATFSLIQLLSIPLAVWLVVKGVYVVAVPVALNYFLAGIVAFRLNPHLFLKKAANKAAMKLDTNKTTFYDKQVIALEAVMEQLQKAQSRRYTD